MLNPFEIIGQAKERKAKRELLPRIHHTFMKEYGWISLDEFKKLPLPLVWSLISQINEERKTQMREAEKQKGKMKFRGK